MIGEFDLGPRLVPLVNRIVDSFVKHPGIRHIDRGFLPSRAEMIEVTRLLLELAYPGYIGRQDLCTGNVPYHVGELLPRLGQKLFFQIFRALCYQNELDGQYDPNGSDDQAVPFHHKARQLAMEFVEKIPDIRGILADDVQAAFDGDPAATNTDEIIVAYPGVLAVSVYRFAHELHRMAVPLLPRIMSEWVHGITGIDLHPGATIGRRFFIDHGTGVVVGETAVIGDNVKIYQGVTLGALSFLKDDRGRMVRGYKRHPTVKDGVTLYANAIVLGGDTMLGENSVVGGSTFITKSIPANHVVSINPPELKMRSHRPAKSVDPESDFVI